MEKTLETVSKTTVRSITNDKVDAVFHDLRDMERIHNALSIQSLKIRHDITNLPYWDDEESKELYDKIMKALDDIDKGMDAQRKLGRLCWYSIIRKRRIIKCPKN